LTQGFSAADDHLLAAAVRMAVPKKKTSKGKRNQRHAQWKAKAGQEARRALSIGKAVLSGRAQGFVYPIEEQADEGEE
jgi:large subunit ribosomal protein L32